MQKFLCSPKWLLTIGTAGMLMTQACSSTMHDDAGETMGSGIAKAREGLAVAEDGIARTSSDSKEAGLSKVDSGVGMMASGMTMMEERMAMMSDDMMKGCCRGSQVMMTGMQEAMHQIRDGKALVTDADDANDDDGITQMQDGASAMNTALDEAQSSMNCMGHSSGAKMMM